VGLNFSHLHGLDGCFLFHFYCCILLHTPKGLCYLQTFSWPRVAGLSLKLVLDDIVKKVERMVKDFRGFAPGSLVSLSTRLISFVTASVSEGQKRRV
jgi:hypothetical protein